MPVTGIQERLGITAQDFDAPVVCPGGERIVETGQGPACRCKVAADTVTAAVDPSSLRAYCMGNYIECPIWQDAKQRQWEARKNLLDDHVSPERTLDFDSVPISDRIPLDPEQPLPR